MLHSSAPPTKLVGRSFSSGLTIFSPNSHRQCRAPGKLATCEHVSSPREGQAFKIIGTFAQGGCSSDALVKLHPEGSVSDSSLTEASSFVRQEVRVVHTV